MACVLYVVVNRWKNSDNVSVRILKSMIGTYPPDLKKKKTNFSFFTGNM